MNKKQKIQKIIEGLDLCTKEQQDIFLKLYKNFSDSPDYKEVVKALPARRLDWALTQVLNTIFQNSQPKQEKEPEPIIVISIEDKIKPFAIEAADENFFETKNNSKRSIIGGSDSVTFKFEDKDYAVNWQGWWDKADWYEYEVSGNGINFKDTRYFD